MQRSEIENWLIQHGFEKLEDDSFAANFGEARVVVSLNKNRFKTSIISEGQMFDVIEGFQSRLKLGEHGMLNGAGLFTLFSDRDHPDFPPKWWPETMVEEFTKSMPRA